MIPCLRDRLVFAQIAAQAVRHQPFARILVDLPRFMQASTWIEDRLRAFPLASSRWFAPVEEDRLMQPDHPREFSEPVQPQIAGFGQMLIPESVAAGPSLPAIRKLGGWHLISLQESIPMFISLNQALCVS